jgi:hypothetical protein
MWRQGCGSDGENNWIWSDQAGFGARSLDFFAAEEGWWQSAKWLGVDSQAEPALRWCDGMPEQWHVY